MTNTHKFTVDDNIINHLITHQAGTPNKALMELVMNSIDAGATRIDIEATDRTFCVKDNGAGFAGKEDVINYFGRFGTPHEKGDAVFGRFRMGRGQIMAFGKCLWRSSTFQMNVDIKGSGLTYVLHEDLDMFHGCEVSGEFYDTEGAWLDRDFLARQLLFVSAELFVNGEKISRSMEDEQWDYESELFYYKKNDKYSLAVYNQGVYVNSYPTWNVGVGGMLVSKIAMEVNFARNDVLVADCSVWIEAMKLLKKEAKGNAKKSKIPKYERQYHLQEFLKCEPSYGEFKEFAELKLFEDVNGKLHSLENMMSSAIQSITISPEKGSAFADYLASMPGVFVFDAGEMEHFGSMVARNGLYYLFKCIFDKTYGGFSSTFNRWVDSLAFFENINGLRERYPNRVQILKSTELTPLQKAVVKSLKSASDIIGSHAAAYAFKLGQISHPSEFPIRKLVVGNSDDTMEAWTDAVSYIAIDYRQIEQEVQNGQDGVYKLLMLIAHEYTHSDASFQNNVHGLEFYKSYHDRSLQHLRQIDEHYKKIRLSSKGYGMFDLAYRTSKTLYGRITKEGLKTPDNLNRLFNGGITRSYIHDVMEKMRIIEMPLKWEYDRTFNKKIAKIDTKNKNYLAAFDLISQILAKRASIKGPTIGLKIRENKVVSATIEIEIGRKVMLELRAEKIELSKDREAIIRCIRQLDYELALLGGTGYWIKFDGFPDGFPNIKSEYDKCRVLISPDEMLWGNEYAMIKI